MIEKLKDENGFEYVEVDIEKNVYVATGKPYICPICVCCENFSDRIPHACVPYKKGSCIACHSGLENISGNIGRLYYRPRRGR